MANIIPTNPLNPLLLGEVVTGVTGMVREIATYKRAIAELEVQREQMRHQAEIMIRRIDAQLHSELKRIDALLDGFKAICQHSDKLIEAEKQNREQTTQLLNQILLILAKPQDIEQLRIFSQIYESTRLQLAQSNEVMTELKRNMHDAHQQFGISISQRDRDWINVSA